ncbi:MAG: methylthioribulose 1-phosphate dehydratase [Planctomycetes bacterium]|nr:methylthioribulose 1-phosphate dehydratase [Planctomycetota bacterium]
MSTTPDERAAAARALQEVGSLCYERGWSPGTSGNYSLVLARTPLRLLVTASGRDKRRLGEDDFVLVGADGRAVGPDRPSPSAETLLHATLAEQAGAGAVLHTHSVWATLLSDLRHADGSVVLEGYELLKGLAGIETHDCRVRLEIFENTQDMADVARRVRARLSDSANPLRHGFLLRRHGLYTWGSDLPEARRHLEVLEFLLEVVVRGLTLSGTQSLVANRVGP